MLARFGELYRPGALLAGIDFEESGAVVAAGEAIADAHNRPRDVRSTAWTYSAIEASHSATNGTSDPSELPLMP